MSTLHTLTCPVCHSSLLVEHLDARGGEVGSYLVMLDSAEETPDAAAARAKVEAAQTALDGFIVTRDAAQVALDADAAEIPIDAAKVAQATTDLKAAQTAVDSQQAVLDAAEQVYAVALTQPAPFGAMMAGSPILTLGAGEFTVGMVSGSVTVAGAGAEGADLTASILSLTARRQAILNVNAGTSVDKAAVTLPALVTPDPGPVPTPPVGTKAQAIAKATADLAAANAANPSVQANIDAATAELAAANALPADPTPTPVPTPVPAPDANDLAVDNAIKAQTAAQTALATAQAVVPPVQADIDAANANLVSANAALVAAQAADEAANG